ncbi:hypothetical protein ACVRXS_10575 [Streptococcus orisratti]|uniref:hypothetical protein n=1 Tax=Streptococcus orisratti TaxID=114652 RepID=UPI00039BE007|nr:hypothetical protein [Streptococcus orisratti]
MLNKKNRVFVLIVLTLVLSFFSYRLYCYGDFKRTYESGASTYEQFYSLTRYDRFFGKQYVDDVKKAGYNLDDYNLKMMDRIPALISKKLGIEFVPQETYISLSFNYVFDNRRINVFQRLNKDMNRDGEGIYFLIDENGNDIERIELTDAEKQELTEIAIAELEDLLADVYHSMYPEEK